MARGRVILTDFGLAKSITTGSRYTRSGEALGTPAYMSPEQARGETQTLTPTSDVWSLGCVLYEMLAAHPAFDADTPAATIGRILTSEPPRLVAVPAPAQTLVDACLHKEAARRYPDAGAARADCDRVLAGGRPVARGRRRRGVWAMAAVGVVTAAGLGAVALGRAGASGEAGPPATVDTRAGEAAALATKGWGLRVSDPAAGARLLGQAVAQVPERAEWRVQQGLCWWIAGRNAEARDAWAAVSPASPAAARARLYTGLEALWRRERGVLMAGDARPHLEAVAAGAGAPAVLAQAALAFLDREYRRARELLDGVVGWEAALLRGSVEGQDPDGDLSLAVAEYTRAFDEGLPMAWILDARGFAHMRLRHLDAALADYDRALEMDPANVGTHYNRGVALTHARRFDAAIAAFNRIISQLEGQPLPAHLHTQLAEAFQNRGLVYQYQGDLARARADVNHALELEPTLVQALVNHGNLCLADRDFAGALVDAERALRLAPEKWEPWVLRGTARFRQRDAAGALEDFNQAAACGPTEPRVFVNRAATRGSLGDLEGAITDYQHALDLAPPDWPARAQVEASIARTRRFLAQERRSGR